MKTLAIISQKGGAGKTTIAVHLAVEAERNGYVTAVFDMDPQGSAASWGDKRKAFSDFPAVVTAQSSRLPTLMDMAKGQGADLVIIDSAPNADAASSAAAKIADLILIPCRPAAFDLNAIGTTLELANLARKPAWVVLNAVASQSRIGEEAGDALKAAGVQVADILLHHLVAFSHSVNDGRTASEFDPKSKAGIEIEALFGRIEKQLGLTQRNQRKRTA